MKAEDADNIIADYMGLIFRFALTKEYNIDKAEEVAARIVFDVYKSLLKVNSIEYIDSYIYTISCNVYAKFVEEEQKQKHLSEYIHTTSYVENDSEAQSHDTDHTRLRREILYLGKTHREIILMSYFEKMKLYEIAQKLNIPLRSVKWHLNNARNKLKEGMLMQFKDITEAKPIRFSGVGQEGTLGTNGENVDTYLGMRIAQNIAYSAYYEAKSITEIARDLCIPALYIENEIEKLVEYSYIDKIAGDKYLTNILIIEPSLRALEQKNQVYQKYAKFVCDLYIPLLFKAMEKRDVKSVYTPKNDLNFLMWSVVSFASKFKLTVNDKSTFLKKFHVKRKDGSENIAFAWLEQDFKWQELSYIQKLYDVLEDINSYSTEKKRSWQFNTYYDTRQAGWEDYVGIDYENLYDHITGKITKTSEHVEKYARLYEKCYLVSMIDKDYVNIVVAGKTENDFLNLLPEMPTKLKTISKELDKEMFEIDKTQFPKHMHEICQAWDTDVLTSTEVRTRVLEQLLNNGLLKPLTETQKASVNTIMFSDVLPK